MRSSEASYVASRNAKRLWLTIGLVVLVACNAVLGTERAAKRDASAPSDAGSDAPEVDAVRARCGDMSGFLPSAPWPTGGACNTRISRAAVPTLRAPVLKWQYDAGGEPGSQFMSGPAVGPDGTVYATYKTVTRLGGGFTTAYSLLAVRSGGLQFKTAFRTGFGAGKNLPSAVPALAADGSIYAISPDGVQAFDATGAYRWTYPIDCTYEGRANTPDATTSSPAILPDGTVIVTGRHKVAAVRSNGGEAWSFAGSGGGFIGSAAVTPSGLIVAAEAPWDGNAKPFMHAFRPNDLGGRTVANFSNVDEWPLATPLVVEDGSFGVLTKTGFHVFSTAQNQVVEFRHPEVEAVQPFGVYVPPYVYFGGSAPDGGGSVRISLDGGAPVSRPEERMMAAAGDGSLVLLERRPSDGVVTVSGVDPSSQETWKYSLSKTMADEKPPALAADGAAVIALGPTVYWLGDE